MRRPLGTLATTLAAAVAGLALAAPAGAEQVTVRDQRHDVSETRVGDGTAFVTQSNIREGDFIATTFRHGRGAVVVTSRFRDLAHVGKQHGYFLRLETDRHVYRDVTVQAGPGSWSGRLAVTNRRGERVRCGARHLISYGRDLVRVTVPRTCLGRPHLVRGTAAVMWTRADTDDASQPDYLEVDNPHNTEPTVNSWTRWIRRS